MVGGGAGTDRGQVAGRVSSGGTSGRGANTRRAPASPPTPHQLAPLLLFPATTVEGKFKTTLQ